LQRLFDAEQANVLALVESANPSSSTLMAFREAQSATRAAYNTTHTALVQQLASIGVVTAEQVEVFLNAVGAFK